MAACWSSTLWTKELFLKSLPDLAAIFATQVGSVAAQYLALNIISNISSGQIASEAAEAISGGVNAPVDFKGTLAGAGFAAIGSYATSQLVALLDIDPEYAPFITAPSNAAFSKIGNNIANLGDPILVKDAAGNLVDTGNVVQWNTGVGVAAFNALGSVAGAFLANEIGQWDTYTEQLGSQLGSSIGGTIGQFLIPIPFVGAFIGSLVGRSCGRPYWWGCSGMIPSVLRKLRSTKAQARSTFQTSTVRIRIQKKLPMMSLRVQQKF